MAWFIPEKTRCAAVVSAHKPNHFAEIVQLAGPQPSKLMIRVRTPIAAPLLTRFDLNQTTERIQVFLNAEHESVFVQWCVFWLKCWWLVALTGGQFLVLLVGLSWRAAATFSI